MSPGERTIVLAQAYKAIPITDEKASAAALKRLTDHEQALMLAILQKGLDGLAGDWSRSPLVTPHGSAIKSV